MNFQPLDTSHRLTPGMLPEMPSAAAPSPKAPEAASVMVGTKTQASGLEMGCVEEVPDQALVRNDPLGGLFQKAFDFPAPPPPSFTA